MRNIMLAIFSLMLVFVSETVFAQNDEIVLTQVCSYFGESLPTSVHSFSSDSEAENIVSNIMAVTGLPKNFRVRAAGVPNAAAVIKNNERYILYSQNFIHNLSASTGSKWSPYSVMAHEIGHHLAGHTLSNHGSRPSLELEADKYSGFIMSKLGATLEDAQATIKIMANDQANDTHPAKHDRLAAIANGWYSECSSTGNCEKQEILNESISDDISGVTLGSLAVNITNNEIHDNSLHPRVRIMNIKAKYYQGIPLVPNDYHVVVDLEGYSSFDSWVKVERTPKVIDVYLKKSDTRKTSSNNKQLKYGAISYSRQGFMEGYLGYSKADAKARALAACKRKGKSYCVIVENFTECIAVPKLNFYTSGIGPTKSIALREMRSACKGKPHGNSCRTRIAMCTDR